MVREARENGFTAILWYLSVDDVGLLDRRITVRSNTTYRDYIEPSWMLPRYEAGLKALPGYFDLFDWAGLLDASAEHDPRVTGLLITNMRIFDRLKPVPRWAGDLMDRYEAMNEEAPDNAKSGGTKI